MFSIVLLKDETESEREKESQKLTDGTVRRTRCDVLACRIESAAQDFGSVGSRETDDGGIKSTRTGHVSDERLLLVGTGGDGNLIRGR
jgi:hypothetical protein